MTDTSHDIDPIEQRRLAQEAADERATRLLKRVGAILLVLLAAWVVIVFVGVR